MPILRIISITIIIFFCSTADAANHYICSTGDNSDGSTWTKAFTSIPANLTRGDTYYFCGGDTWGAYTLDDAVSGTSVITWKKCISTDSTCTSATGYTESMGTGQTKFGQLNIATDYVTIDGASRTAETSGHGFNFEQTANNPNTYGIVINGSNVTIQYVEITHGSAVWGSCDHPQGIYAIYGKSDIMVSYSYLHELITPIQLGGNTGFTIQYSVIRDNYGSGSCHSEAIAATNETNLTVRYNKIANIWGTGAIVALDSGTTNNNDGWKIYDNIFYKESGGNDYGFSNGVVACINNQTCNNLLFYNNTIVNWIHTDGQVRLQFVNDPSGVEIKNNLWWCSGTCNPAAHTTGAGITVSNNWYSNAITHNDESTHYGNESDPFTASGSYVFTLAAGADPIDKGATLTGYATDFAGNSRSGTWDIGAYEYIAWPSATIGSGATMSIGSGATMTVH